MAYPNPIKTTGALSIGADVFEYFKGALLDNSIKYKNPEGWPYWINPDGVFQDDSFIQSRDFYYLQTGSVGNLSLPMNRDRLYKCFDYWSVSDNNTTGEFKKIGSTSLYTFSEPVSGWTVDQVNTWGKMKCVEFALFGNVGNGGSLTTNSLAKFNGMTMQSSVNTWTNYDMNYLRYGLIKFDSYGSCHPNTD